MDDVSTPTPMELSSPGPGRGQEERPLYRLTVDLLETYKHINTIYYEKKKYNDGFDDKHGDYIIRAGDLLDGRYELMDKLGSGSFGQVASARDLQTGETCAVKILKNRKPFYNQGLVEVRTLQYLNSCDPDGASHTVRMLTSFVHRQHLCLVFELLGLNLYEVLRRTNFAGLSMGLVRRFAHQLVHALYFMATSSLVHCDLKPENILLKENKRSHIKVIDFGSSCLEREKMFKYIQSRFYRAPEVILELDYGPPCDMWSLGCILVELLTGDPLFPGEDETDQLGRMVELLGMPPLHMIENSAKARKMFVMRPGPRPYWELRRPRPASSGPPRTLDAILGVPSEISRRAPRAVQQEGIARLIFRDLVARMLAYDPAQRITPLEALHHYYFCTDEIARYILDSNTLQRPAQGPTIPAYPASRHPRDASRHYTENALREAARLLDRRFPGIKMSAVHPTEDEEPMDPDLERQLHNMSISPREPNP